MIKKIIIPLLFMILALQACLKDPDPVPQTIDTYEYYYNYLTEPYDIQWEFDDQVIGSGHSYGMPAHGIIQLDTTEQSVLFKTRNQDTDMLLDSLSYTLYQNGAFMLALIGNEAEPHLLCEPVDTRFPSEGMIKIRFLHAAATLDPVDIYIGGDLPEDRVLSGFDYTTVSEYLEVTEEKLWTAIIVTPAYTLPADSTIVSYYVNTVFQTGWSFLCVLAHSDNSIESPYGLQVDDQPVN
jgi:hypothetical protein